MMLGIEEIMCELSGSGGGGESEMNGGRGGGGGGGLPPGFRFHPTDEELLTFYLASKVFNSATLSGVDIAEVDLNRIEPWELPEVAKMGEREWYFFSLRDRKYPTGLRTNRATGAGYWKATGKDREVYSSGSGQTLLGMKKTLVFYKGRAPRGEKTKWVMHEYRLDGDFSFRHMCKEEWVICRIFHKLGEKKVNGGHGQSCYPHFHHHHHHQIMEPPSPTPSTMTKKPFATTIPESTTPLMQNDPPMPQTPFLFGDSLENIHDQDLKSLLNHLPLYPCIQTGPNPSTYTNAVNPSPSLVKSFPLSNQSITIPVAKQCKTEAHFSNLQLPDANLRWWGTDKTCEPHLNNYNSSPSPLLLPFGQQDLGEMDYFLNTTLPAAAGDGGTRSTAEGTSVYKRLRTGGLDRVGFNQMLLPSI